MPEFRHKRTGKIIHSTESDAFRYRNDRYEPIGEPLVRDEMNPKSTVPEVLAWVAANPGDRELILDLERAGKNRKGIIDALS